MKFRYVLLSVLMGAMPLSASESEKEKISLKVLCGVGAVVVVSIYSVFSWYNKVTKKPTNAPFPQWYRDISRENIFNFRFEGEVALIEFEASKYQPYDLSSFLSNDEYKEDLNTTVNLWKDLPINQKKQLKAIYKNLIEKTDKAHEFVEFYYFVSGGSPYVDRTPSESILYEGMEESDIDIFNKVRELFRIIPIKHMVQNNVNPFWYTHLPQF